MLDYVLTLHQWTRCHQAEGFGPEDTPQPPELASLYIRKFCQYKLEFFVTRVNHYMWMSMQNHLENNEFPCKVDVVLVLISVEFDF